MQCCFTTQQYLARFENSEAYSRFKNRVEIFKINRACSWAFLKTGALKNPFPVEKTESNSLNTVSFKKLSIL